VSLRRDFEQWVIAQLRRRGLSDSKIRRLLLDFYVPGLDRLNRNGLPAEILEARPLWEDNYSLPVLYLETGIIGFPDLLICSNGGEAGTLYFNDTIDSYITARDDAFSMIGELALGSESLTAYPPLPDFPGSVETPEGESLSLNCDRSFYKESIYRTPPSIFSGKLRLLVQALYGSKTAIVSDWQPTSVKINQILFSSSPSLSLGLYTYDDERREYWFLRIYSTGSVTAAKLSFTDEGQRLIDYIHDNPTMDEDDIVRLEAFAFTTVKLGNLDWVEIETDAPGIAPLSYGWRFNSSGSEARAVSVTGNEIDGYTFSEQEATFSLAYIGDEPDWTVTTDDTENAADIALHPYVHLWRLTEGGYTALIGSSPPDTVAAVPYFGWWDESDTWQTDTYQGWGTSDVVDDIEDDFTGNCFETATGNIWDLAYVYSTSGQIGLAQQRAGVYTITSQPCGFSVCGYLQRYGTYQGTLTSWNTGALPTNPCRPDVDVDCTDVGPPSNLFRWRRLDNYERVYRTPPTPGPGSGLSARTCVAPARGDCDHLYVGDWLYITDGQSSIIPYRRVYSREYEFECYVEPGVYTPKDEWEEYVSLGTGWLIDGSAETSGTHNASEVSFYLHGRGESVETYTGSGTSGTAETDPYRFISFNGKTIDLTNEFDPISGPWNPYFGIIDIPVSSLFVKSSYKDMDRGYVAAPGEPIEIDDETYALPEDTYWSFVGWI